MSDDKVVIVSAKRTPIGSFQGNFQSLKATELGSRVIEKNINDISINPKEIDETIMGCVLPAGLGQAPARQAAMGAGIPSESGATTINKMCGSGMKSIMFGHDSIKAKQNKFEEAKNFYEKGIKIDPNFALLYNNIGLLYSNKNHEDNFKKAERKFERFNLKELG